LLGHAGVLAPKGANRDQIQRKKDNGDRADSRQKTGPVMRTASGIASGSSDIAPIRALPVIVRPSIGLS
jgi:hypothetical protein